MNAVVQKLVTTPSLRMTTASMTRMTPRTMDRLLSLSFHTSSSVSASADWHGTTILCVRKNGQVCMMGDGQVTMGSMTVKPNAKKIRRITSKIGESKGTIVGFAGSTADAFTLLERLEAKLDEYPGQLARSCVELAKGWRTDKYLRRLEASLLVADETVALEITGNGDVLESNDGVLGVGSGSPYALAAARALIEFPELSAEDVARKAMKVASEMCVYTNSEYLVEVMDTKEALEEVKKIEAGADKKTEVEEDKKTEVGVDKKTEVGVDKITEVEEDKKTEVGMDKKTEVGVDKKTEVEEDKITEVGVDKITEVEEEKITEVGVDKKTEVGVDKKTEVEEEKK